MSVERIVHLPEPDGVRGGGEPWWHEGIRGASITPTAPWNRDDEDVPTLDLVNVQASGWTLPEARRFALAILAAADYAEQADAEEEPDVQP